jgi:hypothetical protein
MLTIIDGRVPAAAPLPSAPTLDEPTCIFAALIDGLTDRERYAIEVRNGELYIQPTLRRDRLKAGVITTDRAA